MRGVVFRCVQTARSDCVRLGRGLLAAIAISLLACSAQKARTGESEMAPGLVQSGVILPDGKKLPNLTALKNDVQSYHESGAWGAQIQEMTNLATRALDELMPGASRPAIVFDIDDTALSTYPIQRGTNFGFIPALWNKWVDGGPAPANQGVLDLYRHARSRGAAVFFITGRNEAQRQGTERQLRAAGYDAWSGLFFKPDKYALPSVIPYKSSVRREIEAVGYTILVNVGDQFSDLEGGFSRATFKIPNPIYYIP